MYAAPTVDKKKKSTATTISHHHWNISKRRDKYEKSIAARISDEFGVKGDLIVADYDELILRCFCQNVG